MKIPPIKKEADGYLVSDIFLSYATADRERIRPLVAALTYQNWSVWWDRDISIGKTWQQVLANAIDSAKCVIVVWSSESAKSQWVSNEAVEGMRRGILLPVVIDDVSIPLGFRHLQAANLIGWRGDLNQAEFRKLCRGIWTLTHRPESRAATAGGGTVNPFVKPSNENPVGAPERLPLDEPKFYSAPQTSGITANHLVGSLCYLLGPGGLIILVFRKFSKDRFVRFHAFQASLLFMTWLILMAILPFRWAVFFVGVFAWMFLVIVTFVGRPIKIPLLQGIAEKLV